MSWSNWCYIHGYYYPIYNNLCPYCNWENSQNFKILKPFEVLEKQHKQEKQMLTRKYLPTLSDLLDRLTIVQQKELKIPEHREEYTKELEDLMHDIKLCLQAQDNLDSEQLTQMLRDLVVLTLMNCEIWHNESLERQGKGDGSGLRLSHSLNGIRNTAKNKIQEQFGGRKDYKVDNVSAHPQWIPSKYDKL